MQNILILMFMSLMFVACGHQKDAKSFESALETYTGQPHTIVKLNTEKGNFVVYRNDTTGEYTAYNMDKWDRENMTTLDQYAAAGAKPGTDVIGGLSAYQEWVVSGYWEDVYETYTVYDDYYDYDCECWQYDSYTYSQVVGQQYVDTSHWYTFYAGGGFRFENTSGRSKDLDTLAALKEDVAQSFMAMKLKSDFSLSSTRAEELAKLASRYQKLENARELTSPEKDKFAMDALGVSMSQVENALKEKAAGNESAYDSLLQTAAKVNSTTPEQIGKFFNEMVIDNL